MKKQQLEIPATELAKLNSLAQELEVRFNDFALLKQALIHRSYLNEVKEEALKNNERLEFLGDAVLELIVTEYLFKAYPERLEGELTSFRSATVRTESLAETALKLGIGNYIYMSKGEESTGGRTRPYILANTFEALLGAIYLDQGMPTAIDFITKFLLPKIVVIVKNRLDIDSKSKLQELSQEATSHTPAYIYIGESGPDHSKIFEMAVMIGEHKFGAGKGKSKQEAEQNAAQKALKSWSTLIRKFYPHI